MATKTTILHFASDTINRIAKPGCLPDRYSSDKHPLRIFQVNSISIVYDQFNDRSSGKRVAYQAANFIDHRIIYFLIIIVCCDRREKTGRVEWEARMTEQKMGRMKRNGRWDFANRGNREFNRTVDDPSDNGDPNAGCERG